MKKWRGDSDKVKRAKRQALNALLVNVADGLNAEEQREIAMVCLEDFESDRESRAAWDAMHADWVAVYNQQDAAINQPWPDSSDESLGLLTEACNSFQSRAYKAFFPSRMPVAAIPLNPQNPEIAARAKRVGNYLQWSLFVRDQNYKEEKSAMLLRVAIHGSDFSKTYFDPVMNQIMVRPVRAEDLYVPYTIGPVSIEQVPRKTELIHLPLNEGRIRAQEGYFLFPPEPMIVGQIPSPLREQQDSDTGIHPAGAESEDYAEIIEQHRDLDIDGDGIAEPYKIWVDVTSQKLLRIEVRYEVDQTGRPLNGRLPIEEYTHYRFLANPDGFYGYGLGFLLGATNTAINKLLRQFIDATTLSIHGNLSGFISETLNVDKGPLKIELGSFKSVSASTDDIQKGIKTLNFPAPPQQLMQAIAQLENRAQRIGATTDAAAGDVNKVFQPTTIQTMVEQSLVMFTSVQEFLLHSWSKELTKVYRLNSIYFRGAENFVAMTPEGPQSAMISEDDFADDMMILPIADPRLSSQQSRLQKAQFLFDFATKNPLIANNPEILLAVSRRLLEEMEIDGIDAILPRTAEELPPSPPDPKAVAEQARAQIEQQKLALEAQSAQQELALEAQKLQMQQQIDQARIVGDQQLQAMRVENERAMAEMRLANERSIAQEKLMLEREIQQMKVQADMQIEREKVMAQIETDRQRASEQQRTTDKATQAGNEQMKGMVEAIKAAVSAPREVTIKRGAD